MVDITTIRANAYTALYNLLSDTTKGIGTTNIHSRYSDNNWNKEGAPQVIIKVLVSRKSEGFTRKGQFAVIYYNIVIYHNSPENARNIADRVDKSITENYADLASDGIRPKDDEEMSEDADEVYGTAKRYISIISITYPFIYRQQL